MFVLPYWVHPAMHVVLIALYFILKVRLGKTAPATIERACLAALGLTFVHTVVLGLSMLSQPTRALLGLAISAGLLLLFNRLWQDARSEAAQ